MSQQKLTELSRYLRRHWRRVSLLGILGIAGLMIVVQLVYPWGAMPLYATIDGIDVGGRSGNDTQQLLEDKYKAMTIGLYFGSSPKPYREPKIGDIGTTVISKDQVASAQYSWWLRLVPTSLWWAHSVVTVKPPSYSHDMAKTKAYVAKELGESCDVTAVNASLLYKDKKLQVQPAIDGGTCDLTKVEQLIGGITPTFGSRTLRVPMNERPAKIHNDAAAAFADSLTQRTKDGITIAAAGQTVTVSQADVFSWLDFTAPDSGIVATVSGEKSKTYFEKEIAPKVAIAAGTSKVTTLDFMQVSEILGSNGRALDVDGTIAALNAWLKDANESVVAKTKVVAPNVSYTRTYTATDTGLTALMTQFAQARPGTFGVSFAELDGKRRHASYQADKVFRTASTYKLFVAHGALKRVESGAWHWTDQINGGRDLTKCLDDMIVKSDNPCGETMLEKIGYKTLTNELKAIGLTKARLRTVFPKQRLAT